MTAAARAHRRRADREPVAGHLHQRVVVRLTITLEAAGPDNLEVLCAPFDVAIADDTVMAERRRR